MRAVGYTRVSTAAQATEDRVSLTEQQTDIQAYSDSKGYELVSWYSDVGSGASKRRKEFQRMLKGAREYEFDVIIAWKSDRLARGIHPYAALSEALEGTNIAIEGVKDVLDAKIMPIMAAIGKLELDNIRERARMGLRGRAHQGKAPSLIKFGYSKDAEGFPIINEVEAAVIR
ncbi:MAG: recombinase family protein [SAR202 cluster bacterium]|jgi:site-specific DNA recombinase|nr:recombinase family protein [SAR202 cluster bacterium]